jgi:hypothetical protein
MENFMIMQVAMEASAMPPPASTAGSDDTRPSEDASFDNELEKALNSKPDDEALALATEAVVVLLQTPVIQPMFDGNAPQAPETDALTIAQKLVALIEGQTQQTQPEILAVDGGNSGDGEAEKTGQKSLATQVTFAEVLVAEAPANEQAQGVVVAEPTTSAETEKLELAAETAVKTGNSQGKKATVESASASESSKSAQSGEASTAAEQVAEKPVLDLTTNIKTDGDGKAKAPVEVAKGNNDPSQPDTSDGSTVSKQSGKTVDEANVGEIKIELTKTGNPGKQAADSTAAQASSNSSESAKPRVEENAAAEQAPVSESKLRQNRMRIAATSVYRRKSYPSARIGSSGKRAGPPGGSSHTRDDQSNQQGDRSA